MEISITQTMVTKGFDNDKVGGDSLKPFRKLDRLLKKGDNARTQLISIKQYTQLLDEASFHIKTALIIGFNTGMRLGEIRQLKWNYIDRKGMMIRLPKDVTKERKEKNIPINQNIRTMLDSLPRALNGFVVTYNGKPIIDKNGLKKGFAGACKKAKVPYGRKVKNGITFHDIRRTVKTNMLNAGVDKVFRDAILGHSMKGMDKHYIVSTDEALTKAMTTYTAWLDEQIKMVDVDQAVDQEAVSL